MDLIAEFIAQIVFWHWGVLAVALTLAASLVRGRAFLAAAVGAIAAGTALFFDPSLAPAMQLGVWLAASVVALFAIGLWASRRNKGRLADGRAPGVPPRAPKALAAKPAPAARPASKPTARPPAAERLKPVVQAKLGTRPAKPRPDAATLVGRDFTIWTPVAEGGGVLRAGGAEWPVTGPDCPAGSRVRVAEVLARPGGGDPPHRTGGVATDHTSSHSV